jgi:hypothetical protein
MFNVITVASGAYAWNLKAKPATKVFYKSPAHLAYGSRLVALSAL